MSILIPVAQDTRTVASTFPSRGAIVLPLRSV